MTAKPFTSYAVWDNETGKALGIFRKASHAGLFRNALINRHTERSQEMADRLRVDPWTIDEEHFEAEGY